MSDERPKLFHEGELEIQRRAGVLDRAQRVGTIIGFSFNEGARRFLAEDPLVVLAGSDQRERVWASLLLGPPGFLVAGEHELEIQSRPHPDDPLARLAADARVGLLAIELTTGRRLRVNGRLIRQTADSFTLAPNQIYANCPKYIQRRPTPTQPGPLASRTTRCTSKLSDQQCCLILQPIRSSSPVRIPTMEPMPPIAVECLDSSRSTPIT